MYRSGGGGRPPPPPRLTTRCPPLPPPLPRLPPRARRRGTQGIARCCAATGRGRRRGTRGGSPAPCSGQQARGSSVQPRRRQAPQPGGIYICPAAPAARLRCRPCRCLQPACDHALSVEPARRAGLGRSRAAQHAGPPCPSSARAGPPAPPPPPSTHTHTHHHHPPTWPCLPPQMHSNIRGILGCAGRRCCWA